MFKDKVASALFIILISFTSVLSAQNRFVESSKELLNHDSKKVFVIAHRGDWRNAPENSLQAIKNVIEMGVDIVEIDIKMTKDKQLIVMHDKALDRTTNGKGLVSDYNLSDIQNLYLRNGAGAVTEHRIPTLEEALRLCKGQIWINIDKGYEYMAEVYDLLEKTGTTNQVILKSGTGYEELLSKYKNILNKIVYMPIIDLNSKDAQTQIKKFADYKPVAIECVFSEENTDVIDLIAQIRKNGSKVWINSLWASLCAGRHDDKAVEQNKEDDTWGWMLDQGVKMIQTDRPKELLLYLKNKGLHE